MIRFAARVLIGKHKLAADAPIRRAALRRVIRLTCPLVMSSGMETSLIV
jgi:hypothetical protein